MRARAQSIVEFALIAPVLILLAMAAWDGGSVLREQVILQQAARDGARAAATAFGGAATNVVQDAVLASAQSDLPSLTTQMITITPAPDPQSVTVTVRYPHALITPVMRQLWGGGGGTVTLQASAIFYVPQLTPTVANIVPSTPTATPSPTPTATPTVTPSPSRTPTQTPTPTPQPPHPCDVQNPNQIQALSNNVGWWCTLQLTSSSFIVASWQDNFDPNNQLLIYLNNPGPFVGQPDPSLLDPNKIASPSLAFDYRAGNGWLFGYTYTPGPGNPPACVAPGTYSVYFFNRGNPFSSSTANINTVPC